MFAPFVPAARSVRRARAVDVVVVRARDHDAIGVHPWPSQAGRRRPRRHRGTRVPGEPGGDGGTGPERRDRDVSDYHHLQRLVAETDIGRRVSVEIIRHRAKQRLELRVAEAPDLLAPAR